jgi:hypothetical protein
MRVQRETVLEQAQRIEQAAEAAKEAKRMAREKLRRQNLALLRLMGF